MNIFRLQAEKLTDWHSFHNEFKNKFEFPEYYGENMNAWIDCMDDQASEENLVIHIENGKILKEKAPKILETLLECAAFVNFRRIEAGEQPTLFVSIFT